MFKIIVIIVLLLIWVLFLFFTRNYKKELFGKSKYLYSPAYFLIEKCHFSKFFSDKQKRRIYNISIGEDFKTIILKYQCQRIVYGIYSGLILLILVLLFSINAMVDYKKEEKEIRQVMRPLHGEGKKEVSKDITLWSKKEDDTKINKNLEIKVQEKQYTKKEWEVLLQEIQTYLLQAILGENKSQEKVRKPLKFPERYPNISIKIQWKTDERIVNADGTLKNTWKDKEFPKDGVLTELTAIISCDGFRTEYTIYINVLPEKYTKAEMAWHDLETLVLKKEEVTRKQDFFELPKKIGNYEIIFNKEERHSALIVMLGIAFIILFIMVPSEKVKEEEKRRERQLMVDYPKVINQFVLLINAGLTIRNAFERLVQEYGKNKKKGEKKKYVYEEMIVMIRAMENGASEMEAIETFGKRIRQLPYLKFTSLLIQNNKKGSEDLLLLLEHEAICAMEQNKERIRIMGEEAGTKLLLPMLVMLCIVFSIIIIPAFMSF